MLHNKITSEREREIFKVNYAVDVAHTHTQFVFFFCMEGVRVERDAFIVRLIERRGMHAVIKLFIYDIFIIIVIIHKIERKGVGEIEILTHLRYARNHNFSISPHICFSLFCDFYLSLFWCPRFLLTWKIAWKSINFNFLYKV